MTTRLFLILSLLFAFLQGPLLPPVFIEGILMVFYLTQKNSFKVPIAVFLSGFIFDLLQNQIIGITALLFLVLCFILRLIINHIPLDRPIFLSLLTFVFVAARAHFVYQTVFWAPFIASLILAYFIFRFVWQPTSRGNRIQL